MIPPIQIKICGNRCSCCADDDPKEFKVVYRGDKNIFVAVPKDQEIEPASIAATRAALNRILIDSYSIHLADLSVDLAPNGVISVNQVRTIEGLAAQKLKSSSSESL